MDVIALSRPKSHDLWALGYDTRLFRTRTALFNGHASGWDWTFAVKDGLDSIASLGDGSVLAVGEEVSVLFDGDRWSTIGSGLKGSRRIWGAHPACVNALTELGLFYFDGRNWAGVELDAQGISGNWADGDCDSSGAGWIVGTYGTHSCMAAGSGTKWRQDGCGSWYLDLVYVGESGCAFAAGGDGLWRHDGARWIAIDDERDVSHFPIALAVLGATPVVIGSKLSELRRIDGVEEAAAQPPTSELEVFTAAGWQTIRVPITLAEPHRAAIQVDLKARLLIGHDSAVWVSSQLVPWSAG